MKKLASVILIGIVLASTLTIVASAKAPIAIYIDPAADKDSRVTFVYGDEPPENGPEIWMKVDGQWILRNLK